MKESAINVGKWIVGLKWWQRILVLLVMFPASLGVIFSTGKSGVEFVYYDLMGNIKLSAAEKHSVLEFQKHWGEDPGSRKAIDINGGKVEVAYFKSDGCTLVTRRYNHGRTLMKWLPYEKEEIEFSIGELIVPSAYAAEEMKGGSYVLGMHEGDLDYVEVVIGQKSLYEYVVERMYVRDGCVGRYLLWAPNGSTCCWQWMIYRH